MGGAVGWRHPRADPAAESNARRHLCGPRRQRLGQRAAYDAAVRWLTEGRRVRVAIPPEPDTDWADVLAADGALTIAEARHAA
jgi:hypothetical protein